MSLFDQLVDRALLVQDDLSPLRAVVEKELLHHDILREMSTAGLLDGLTFMGGTCLRACYGAVRLSEDLDFTGGSNFDQQSLTDLGVCLVDALQTKYGLKVTVTEPKRETGNVDTWKLKLITRPERRDLPAQKINIDICAIPSYQCRPTVLRNRYGVDMGTSGLIIQTESREEILADKYVAFALRPNRLKYRDLWDIGWLIQQNVELPLDLIPKKVSDHQCKLKSFSALLEQRADLIMNDPMQRDGFVNEMRRFLPGNIVSQSVINPEFWSYLSALISQECAEIRRSL